MRFPCLSWSRRPRLFLLSLGLVVLVLWNCSRVGSHKAAKISVSDIQQNCPLGWRHVHSFNGTGGAWYIPSNWKPPYTEEPKTILEAARLAFELADSSHHHIAYSAIPLILHQTWKNNRIDTWPVNLCSFMEKWLGHCVDEEHGGMAYFLWDDYGVLQLLKEYEPAFLETFKELPANVERTDIFRILVSKYIGGIYADIDTEPLKAPAQWISPSDITPWSDSLTDTHYPSSKAASPHPSMHAPVSILLGIEADSPPKADTYWRMGYSYPLQLTQWALASAPDHPVLTRFMGYLTLHLQQISEHHGGNLKKSKKELASIDPVVLTGPAAVTLAAKSWLNEKCGLRWNALTGLQDGGKAKLVEDVLILPITAFSPGRGRYGNMGSKPISDPAARVLHHAQGSWRKLDLKVQLGKACRTLLGRCRDWSTVPDADESVHPGDFLGKPR